MLEKPLAALILRVDDRHSHKCRACVSEMLAQSYTLIHRTCYHSCRALPVEQFTRSRSGSYFSACKACNPQVFPPRRRARMRSATGSYTVAEREALEARHDKCPMCFPLLRQHSRAP